MGPPARSEGPRAGETDRPLLGGAADPATAAAEGSRRLGPGRVGGGARPVSRDPPTPPAPAPKHRRRLAPPAHVGAADARETSFPKRCEGRVVNLEQTPPRLKKRPSWEEEVPPPKFRPEVSSASDVPGAPRGAGRVRTGLGPFRVGTHPPGHVGASAVAATHEGKKGGPWKAVGSVPSAVHPRVRGSRLPHTPPTDAPPTLALSPPPPPPRAPREP